MFIYLIILILVMQDNKELENKNVINSRIDAILKKLDEIVDKHPEIVLKNGVYDYSKAPPEVRAEIDEHLEEMLDIKRENVLWNLAEYYYLRESNSQVDTSIAEYLITEKENGVAFIPDSVIEDLLDKFPELKKVHPKIYETLGQKVIEYPSELRNFAFRNVLEKELEPVFRKIENFTKAGVKGVKVKKENGYTYIKYTNAPPEVKKVLDDTLEEFFRTLTEYLVYNVSYYYLEMTDDPSELELIDGNIVVFAKELGSTFVPNVAVADALNRFPELRKMYPEVAKQYKKFLK